MFQRRLSHVPSHFN